MLRPEKKGGQGLFDRFEIPLPTDDIFNSILSKRKPKLEPPHDAKKTVSPLAGEKERPVESRQRVRKFSGPDEVTKRITIPKSVVLGDDIVRVELKEEEVAMCADALPERKVRWLVPVPPADTKIKRGIDIQTRENILKRFKDEGIIRFGEENYFVSDDLLLLCMGGFEGEHKVTRTGNVIHVFPTAVTREEKLNMNLLRAAQKGNTREMRKLVRKGAEVNAKIEGVGQRTLTSTAIRGHIDAARFLIKKGADVNARNEHGETALTEVRRWINRGHKDLDKMAKFLIKHGAMEAPVLDKGLLNAVEKEKVEEVKEWLEKGADPNARDEYGRTVLMLAIVSHGNMEIIEHLVEKGADVNGRVRLPDKETNEETVLIVTSFTGRAEVVEFLINKGADVNAKDKKGRTALSVAEANGCTEAAKILRKHGATVPEQPEVELSAEDREILNTALLDEMRKGRKEHIKDLLDRGEDVNVRDERGWTPLVCAAIRDDIELMEFLIGRGADVNVRDNRNVHILSIVGLKSARAKEILEKHGATMSHEPPAISEKQEKLNVAFLDAAKREDLGEMKGLANEGADVNAGDSTSGENALMLASAKNNIAMIEFLVEKKAYVNATDKDMRTPLMYAAAKGNDEAIGILSRNGAKASARDKDNKTAYRYAIEGKHHKTAMKISAEMNLQNEF